MLRNNHNASTHHRVRLPGKPPAQKITPVEYRRNEDNQAKRLSNNRRANNREALDDYFAEQNRREAYRRG